MLKVESHALDVQASGVLQEIAAAPKAKGEPPVISPANALEAGNRNKGLTSMAGSMRAKGFEQPAIEGALLSHNQTHCSPPLEDSEVRGIAASVCRYPVGSKCLAAKPSKADELVDMATSIFRLGRSTDGETFAARKAPPTLAMSFRAVRAALAKECRARTGRTPSAAALADAITALEGMAQDEEPEEVAIRYVERDGAIVVDLGDSSGRAVVLRPDGWAVEAVSPVLFRRTALTLPLQEPVQAEPAKLNDLRTMLNVGSGTWPLIVGYLVAAQIPNVPHPVLLLSGEQGTGKSSAARMLLSLIDPSSAPLRSEPRDAEQWAVAAAGSWAFCIDNLSHIAPWLSDSICKAVTGEGVARRKLYTDSDLAVLAFKRCPILTSIDPGAIRGDLGDRLLVADLERIPDEKRLTEAAIDESFVALQPELIGALLSATARTLAALPHIKLARMPRMADFARVLAALDAACPELTGGNAFSLFMQQRNRIADDVVEFDIVAAAVRAFMDGKTTWEGTAGDLMRALRLPPYPKGWPNCPRALAGRLNRVRPALASIGIVHTPPTSGDKTRTHHLENVRIRQPEPPSGKIIVEDKGNEPGGERRAEHLAKKLFPCDPGVDMGGMGGMGDALRTLVG